MHSSGARRCSVLLPGCVVIEVVVRRCFLRAVVVHCYMNVLQVVLRCRR
jgi:hypothetical protein